MKNLLLPIVLLLSLVSCHDLEEYADNPEGNFEALWTILDEHYCFFSQKDIDWDAVHDRYARRIAPGMNREELFIVCADMLNELRDGHVNLSASFNTSYYREWWSAYPQNFNLRVIEDKYFNYNYRQTSGMMYGFLSDNIGYLYYPTFSQTVGEGNLDNVLYFLSSARGLIIDVRDNGGGSLTNVETFVSRFITEPTVVGYISHKTGPGHDDFSEPRAITYRPAAAGRIRWGKPVVVLANRSTFSAANNFVSVMKNLPGVKVAGATTGGGSGMPYSSELPCGWGVRFSACSILDARRESTESGVEPSQGCEAEITPADMAAGRDPILEKAISLLSE